MACFNSFVQVCLDLESVPLDLKRMDEPDSSIPVHLSESIKCVRWRSDDRD
jgi:hypothetical protein